MSLYLTTVSLVVLCLALGIARFNQPKRTIFYAQTLCSRVIGQDGRERDNWTFQSQYSDDLVGRTVGKFCVALAYRKHCRFVRKQEAAQAKQEDSRHGS